MIYINDDTEGEEEELDDDAISLADDVLDEVDADDDVLVEGMEGFGLLEDDLTTKDDAEDEEIDGDEEFDGDESLEDEEEDVDYDSFDDIDEL